jgi:chloramphenicol-sensitive protein RarD
VKDGTERLVSLMPQDKEQKIGTAAAFAAYGMWGLFPLYWKSLQSVEPLQILGHRIVWAALFVLALLALKHRLSSFLDLFREPRRLLHVAGASVLITANWGIYIWAVNSGHVTESSLGYYINPLVSVALGAIFFKDKLDRFTLAAVGVAAAGVAVASVMMGRLPWVSLALALTFGFYGLVKKKAGLEPLAGLAAETAFAAPLALAFLAWRQLAGTGSFGVAGPSVTILLGLAGIVTAVPLLCFAAAANRITLTRMGFIQYVSPTSQLLLGVLVFKERLGAPMLVAFATVIGAVVLYASTRGKARSAS